MSFRTTVIVLLVAGSSGMPTTARGDALTGDAGAPQSLEHACAKAANPVPLRAAPLDAWMAGSLPELDLGIQAYDVRLTAVDGAYEGALELRPMRNHGKYVSCVAHSAEDLRRAGKITSSQNDAMVAGAGQASCGKK